MSYYARATCPRCGRKNVAVHPTTGHLYDHHTPDRGSYCSMVPGGPIEPGRHWRRRDPRIRAHRKLSRLERLRWHYLAKG